MAEQQVCKECTGTGRIVLSDHTMLCTVCGEIHFGASREDCLNCHGTGHIPKEHYEEAMTDDSKLQPSAREWMKGKIIPYEGGINQYERATNMAWVVGQLDAYALAVTAPKDSEIARLREEGEQLQAELTLEIEERHDSDQQLEQSQQRVKALEIKLQAERNHSGRLYNALQEYKEDE